MTKHKDEAMTLEQVRDWHLEMASLHAHAGHEAKTDTHRILSNAIDAAIAARDAKVEVTDAMVERAAKAYWNCSTSDLLRKRLRAALESALATENGK